MTNTNKKVDEEKFQGIKAELTLKALAAHERLVATVHGRRFGRFGWFKFGLGVVACLMGLVFLLRDWPDIPISTQNTAMAALLIIIGLQITFHSFFVTQGQRIDALVKLLEDKGLLKRAHHEAGTD